MPKVKSSRSYGAVGRPGYKSFKYGNFSGRLSVRRLFARNPSKGNSLIGTSKDVIGSVNQTENLVKSVNPRIVKVPHDLKTRATGVKRVVTQKNRSIQRKR